MLEHNRIAKGLQKTKPIAEYLETLDTTKKKDDFIFEETRRIVGGIFQSIVYREYLPLVVGPKLMREYGLDIEPGSLSEYDPNKDATLWHEFGTFSYRFGHTLVSQEFTTIRGQDEEKSSFNLKDVFFNDTAMTNHNRRPWWLSVLKGLTVQNAEVADRFLNTVLTNK